jgi:hypothetical protein
MLELLRGSDRKLREQIQQLDDELRKLRSDLTNRLQQVEQEWARIQFGRMLSSIHEAADAIRMEPSCEMGDDKTEMGDNKNYGRPWLSQSPPTAPDKVQYLEEEGLTWQSLINGFRTTSLEPGSTPLEIHYERIRDLSLDDLKEIVRTWRRNLP